jgi:UDP-GlcNAc:undecaprenyl-phosphate GlcNAc-1-phosphate transferase
MSGLLATLTALTLSMALVPALMRVAPRIGMVDLPDPRKVHTRPVPRVGGLGIAAGAALAVCLMLVLDRTVAAFLLGGAILVAFGAWDDRREIGHYTKFVGQLAAAATVVYWGGVWVSQVPFVAAPLAPELGKPFTVFAIVGMINAMNHSDGLDGLAGGEALISLAGIAYLAHAAGGTTLVLLCCAVAGGLVGFLRFNTHPARVFMGDAGSQFLGFALGTFAVLLTQQVNTGLSKAVPGLLLGLPIVDILAVFAQRAYHRMNWFRATKNHVHHRLLALGLDHYQAVLVIYSVQALLVASGVLLCYEADGLLVGIYVAVSAVVFGALAVAERAGWRANRSGGASRVAAYARALSAHALLARAPIVFVQASVPLFLVAASLFAPQVPADAGPALAVVGGLLAFGVLRWHLPTAPYVLRLGVYATAALAAYVHHGAGAAAAGLAPATTAYLGLLAVAVALVIRFARDVRFGPTTMDFLLVVLVAAAAALSQRQLGEAMVAGAVVTMIILFYACELILMAGGRKWSGVLAAAALLALGIAGSRALVP